MSGIFWLALSLVLLMMAAGFMLMARPIFFTTGERIFTAGLGICLSLGTFFMMTELAGLGETAAGILAVFFLLSGWFWPEIEKNVIRFKDPGMNPK